MGYDLAENYDLTDRLRGWPGFRVGAVAGLVIAVAWIHQVGLVPAVLAGDTFALGIGLQTMVFGLLLAGWIWGLLFRLRAGISWAAGLAVTIGLVTGLVAWLDAFVGLGVDWQIGERALLIPAEVRPQGFGLAMLAGTLWAVASAAFVVVFAMAAAVIGATALRRLFEPWAGRVFPRIVDGLPEFWHELLNPRRPAAPPQRLSPAPSAQRRLPERAQAWGTAYGRAVLILAYGAAVLTQLWIEPAERTDAAFMFGMFAMADGALLLVLADRSRAFAPARRQLRLEAAASIVIGLIAAVISFGLGRPMPFELFYGLVAVWAMLTAGAQFSVSFAMRHGDSAHLVILYTIFVAVTRLVYGVEAAAAPEVVRLAYAQSVILMAVVVLTAMLYVLLGNVLREWPRSEFEAAGRSART
ncbi:MAG: hypothetical protein OXG43_01930 [Chloroflexi bacterium]|nr:hypothetical protein [Chloroflexota bacterium]